MIYASKSTLNLNNLNMLRPKVTKNLTNLLKKFCESRPAELYNIAICHNETCLKKCRLILFFNNSLISKNDKRVFTKAR